MIKKSIVCKHALLTKNISKSDLELSDFLSRQRVLVATKFTTRMVIIREHRMASVGEHTVTTCNPLLIGSEPWCYGYDSKTTSFLNTWKDMK
ncbi:hypothetical protein CEXT_189711 [Caerostris extrusa]|uniref:Uncharacterized protein n=1 Tax=Caerostris extrusa TaxID=172846 RepID=A0AAV4XYF2_CAEEX|nr:hypothetical protein CEXT_189711 [Caerostris extrusa]